ARRMGFGAPQARRAAHRTSPPIIDGRGSPAYLARIRKQSARLAVSLVIVARHELHLDALELLGHAIDPRITISLACAPQAHRKVLFDFFKASFEVFGYECGELRLSLRPG